MSRLRLCATEKLRDFARPKTDMMRLCGTQKCMLQPLRLKKGMLWLCATEEVYREIARPKKRMLRPLRLLMGRLPLRASEIFARFCATQNRYDAFCATQNRYVAHSHDPTKVYCEHCDLKQVCCDFARLRTTNTLFNIFAQLKNIRLHFICMYVSMFYGVWLPPRSRSGTSFATIATQKWVCCNFVWPK